MKDISQAIVAGSLDYIKNIKEDRTTPRAIDELRMQDGFVNRAERRRIAAIQRKKAKRITEA